MLTAQALGSLEQMIEVIEVHRSPVAWCPWPHVHHATKLLTMAGERVCDQRCWL